MKSCQRISFILGIVVVLTLVDSYVFALDNEVTRSTLRGIKGVYVIVDSLTPEIEKSGLIVDLLKTDVELKLRLAGIKVLSNEEFHAGPAGIIPILGVTPTIMKSTTIYIYNIGIMLNQGVILLRQQEDLKVSIAITWSHGLTGFTSNLHSIRDRVKDLVDIFINAYLSVNPKK